jgi:hypothetical protein
MGKYIIYSVDKNNIIRYISNTSPLLWTVDKNDAKIFNSQGEIDADLAEHAASLEKMGKELGLEYKVVKIT